MAEQEGLWAEIPNESVKSLRESLQSMPKSIARDARRDLRHVGDAIIAEQKGILDGSLPGKVVASGKEFHTIHYKSGTTRVVTRTRYAALARAGKDSSGAMRAGIGAGLRTRIVAGKTRSGLNIQTTSSRMPPGKEWMPKTWQKKRFRHPVFNGGGWASQAGQPYFFAPVIKGRNDMVRRMNTIIDDAMKEASK